jgi:hypothetical protein
MTNPVTPEYILEQLKKLDREFVDIYTPFSYKEEWCDSNRIDFNKEINKDPNYKISPNLIRGTDKIELTIFMDTKPEFILSYISKIESYIQIIKRENPEFYIIKKNYLNFKQNEERMIKIIKAMMD